MKIDCKLMLLSLRSNPQTQKYIYKRVVIDLSPKSRTKK